MQFTRATLIVLFFASISSIPSLALAWGDDGHAIVGDIAEHYLNDHARQQVIALLEADHSSSLGDVASWADRIKRQRPETKPWHYVDIPICGSADPNSYCANGACATEQIKRWTAVLKDPKSDAQQKVEALKFIVHLVGDLHQPLHVSDNNDRGGNNIHATFFGQGGAHQNLHAIWDTDMIKRFTTDRGDEATILINRISDQEFQRWSKGTVDDWAAEGHQLAVTKVYKKLPGFACNKPDPDNLALGQQYYAQARPVIQIQLSRAGVRLATILNEALGG